MRVVLLLVVSGVLASCGSGSRVSRVTSGSFTAHASSELPQAVLTVDVSALTGSITPSGGSAVSLTLTRLPEASWVSGCPTNLSATTLETFTIAPDPLVVGSTSIPSARLTAGCGIDGANDKQVALEAGGGSFLKIVFERN